MSEEFEVDTTSIIEFDVPLNMTSYVSLVASLVRDICDVVSDWCHAVFEITAAHSDWVRKQREAQDASEALKRFLEDTDG